jgi:hypothetical protein
MHNNLSLNNQLKVRELITLSRFYCLLLICSVPLATPSLLGILAILSPLSIIGLSMLNQLPPTGCLANGRVVMLSSSIITEEAGEGAAVDVDGETSEGHKAVEQCGWT